MDEQKHAALCRTLDAEHELVTRLTEVNKRFHATLGRFEDRHNMDHAALAEQDRQLEALAEQGHVLYEELLTVHQFYKQMYPPRSVLRARESESASCASEEKAG